ncbi:MAG: hypothetical protein CL912_28355 [Deltaproteobacteria bacterium]|nr:hypothetical protein [Deltaproteobacteria bacterium]
MYSGCSQYDLPTIARRVWDKGHVDCGSSGQRNMMKILILHTQLWGYEGLGYLFCLPVQLMRVLLVAVVVSHRLDVCFVGASKEQHVGSRVSAAPLKFKVELSPQSLSACLFRLAGRIPS